MISVDLATRLRSAGLAWDPVPGDRFAIPGRDLDGRVFVISEMTIETVELATGDLVRFNGTTEWALDSIAQNEVVWLPREAQLRDLLGDRFDRLERMPRGFAVTVAYDGQVGRHIDVDPECAYAWALLAFLEGS